jgi:hypothetical protein
LEKEVLLAATGLNTVSEIAARIPVETLDRVAECVQLLCDRGVLYLKMVPKGTALPPGLSQEHRVASRDKALPCL